MVRLFGIAAIVMVVVLGRIRGDGRVDRRIRGRGVLALGGLGADLQVPGSVLLMKH